MSRPDLSWADDIMHLVDRARHTMRTGSDYSLAKALGVSKTTVSNWTNGFAYPDSRSTELLAKICDVPLDLALALRQYSIAKRCGGTNNETRAWQRIVELVRTGK